MSSIDIILGAADRDREFAGWLNEHSDDEGRIDRSTFAPDDLFGLLHFNIVGGAMTARVMSGVGDYRAVLDGGVWHPIYTPGIEHAQLRNVRARVAADLEAIDRRLAELGAQIEAADA